MEIVWNKSLYRLMKGRWPIAVRLEAGYQIIPVTDASNLYRKISERIWFQSMLKAYPESDQLLPEEESYFCKGLNMVSSCLTDFVTEDSILLIVLRSVQFSECYVQNEAFAACAIQWASEAFRFPMPDIRTSFDASQGRCGRYIFDFL